MPGATRTISQRLSEAAGRDFVGRGDELALIHEAAAAAGRDVLVVHVHGPGGIGKTTLVEAALRSIGPDARTAWLDCRDVEPTPRGFLAALAAALGSGEAAPDVAAIADLIDDGPRRTVIALDAFEAFGLLDTWLRQAFLPAMPDSVMTVIAGRDAPGAGWLAGRGWPELVREVRLGPLGQADAMAMLRSRGLTELQAARANRFARGHPLALELAAGAVYGDASPDELAPPAAAIGQLLDALVAGVPERTLGTLEAAATARRVTEPILRALLERDSVRDEYAELRRLPFVEPTPHGLRLHDVVHEVVAADLAARDPDAHARYRRRALRFFAERARRPAPGARWETTADLIYLIKNPVLRSACFPDGASEHAVEPALARDTAAIRDIVVAREPAGAADLLMRWRARHPDQFFVARGPDGTVEAVLHLAEIGRVDPALLELDAVARAWREHLAAAPPRPGDRVLAMRRWLGSGSGETLSPAVGACWLDVKRVYLELRPRPSRLYSAMGDPTPLWPIFGPLGFAPVGEAVEVDGTTQQPVWLDFGEGSVDGWLTRLVDAEIDADLDAAGGLAATQAGLTAREAEVLALIADGLTNRLIGERLIISEKTAGRHVQNLFAKLRVHNRAQAARIAAERGITSGGGRRATRSPRAQMVHSPDGGRGRRS